MFLEPLPGAQHESFLDSFMRVFVDFLIPLYIDVKAVLFVFIDDNGEYLRAGMSQATQLLGWTVCGLRWMSLKYVSMFTCSEKSSGVDGVSASCFIWCGSFAVMSACVNYVKVSKSMSEVYELPGFPLVYSGFPVRESVVLWVDSCMTRSSTKELFTPFKDPEQEFRSSRKHFKTLSLEKSRSPDFDLFSDQEEYSEEEDAKTMVETMEQYMSKTQVDYGSKIARPKCHTPPRRKREA
ncbi:hypothetical protein Tco_1066520 [Tanacetum coccineum]|uniref:Uncharacterized protein n=1 Tax=Tanacetum coccineum TaxID=301880 RepID=A0ABQ5HCC4_9ASTR